MTCRLSFLRVVALVGALCTPAAARAQTGSPLEGVSLKDISAALRELLLAAMPETLYEAAPGWGDTTEVRTIRWRGQGLKVHPETVRVRKNDGTWKKIHITPRYPAQTLVLELHDLQQVGPDCTRFKVYAAMQANVEYTQWLWESGVRLYSSSARARLRGVLRLHCEMVTRVETTGTFVPDLVFRLRVLHAESSYDNLVVEHIAGVGGSTARLLGEGIRGGLKQWHPSIERNLMNKVNTAVMKAGDSREVRISLSKLLKLSRS
jgi:hypothetical protein